MPQMKIPIVCPKCARKTFVPHQYAGKQIRCFKCNIPLQVPEIPLNRATLMARIGLATRIFLANTTTGTKVSLGLFLLAAATLITLSSSQLKSRDVSAPSPSPPSSPAPPDRSNDDKPSLEFTWGSGGFGNVMIADLTISNRGTKEIKDITITCVFSGASGTVLGSTTKTIYDVVPANETRTFARFNMGFINSQAKRAGCSIDTWR